MSNVDEIGVLLLALGENTRWSIFKAISALGRGNRTEISKKCGNINTTWHHLNVLVSAGLVIRDEVDNRDIQYSINKDTLQKLVGVLGEMVVQ